MIELITDDGEIKTVALRTRHNYNRNNASEETGLSCPEPTLAQQQFKDDADINVIVERFGLTGELPQNLRTPQSGDFTNVTDFQTAMNVVRSSQEAFAELPAKVRERFNNDPGKFLEWSYDPDNLEEARKMGLAKPAPAAPTPTEPKKPAEPTGDT